jgi:hypothetical protein
VSLQDVACRQLQSLRLGRLVRSGKVLRRAHAACGDPDGYYVRGRRWRDEVSADCGRPPAPADGGDAISSVAPAWRQERWPCASLPRSSLDCCSQPHPWTMNLLSTYFLRGPENCHGILRGLTAHYLTDVLQPRDALAPDERSRFLRCPYRPTLCSAPLRLRLRERTSARARRAPFEQAPTASSSSLKF